MPALTKFYQFAQDIGQKVHNLAADALYVALTNTAPNVADILMNTTATPCQLGNTSNAVELAAATGYVKGGAVIGSNGYTQTGGNATLTGNAVSFISTGTIGPFRYAVLYNNTGGAAATRPIIGWWDYGSAITLNNGEALTIGSTTGGANWTAGAPILNIQ